MYLNVSAGLLTWLVDSVNCLDQANCDPTRMNRVEMRDKIMPIINAWLESNGHQSLNEIAFYRRIVYELARTVKLKASDHRDAIRAAWLTYENQKHHYDQWERFLIDTGFGRPATAAELLESPELGSVILFRGQVNLLCIVLLSIFYYIAFTHSFLLYFYLL